MNKMRCEVCGEGSLLKKEELTTLSVDDISSSLPMRFTECDVCGTVSHTKHQERFNRRQRAGFRRTVEGLLTGNEITALRARHGLTQKVAADLFGGGPVAFSKYEAHDVAQSQSMDRLLRLYDEVPAARLWLRQYVGLSWSEVSTDEVFIVHYSAPPNLVRVISRAEELNLLITNRRPLYQEDRIREAVSSLSSEEDEFEQNDSHVQWNKVNTPGIHRSH